MYRPIQLRGGENNDQHTEHDGWGTESVKTSVRAVSSYNTAPQELILLPYLPKRHLRFQGEKPMWLLLSPALGKCHIVSLPRVIEFTAFLCARYAFKTTKLPNTSRAVQSIGSVVQNEAKSWLLQLRESKTGTSMSARIYSVSSRGEATSQCFESKLSYLRAAQELEFLDPDADEINSSEY